MATWKTIKTVTYKDDAGTAASGDVKIRVQYDKDSVKVDQLKIRFVAEDALIGKTNYTDGFYILYNANNNPESIGRISRRLKSPDGKWLDADITPITVSKSWNSDEVTIQDFWICNIGQGKASDGSVTYSSGTKTFYNWFKDGAARENYKATFSSSTLSGLPKATAGSVSLPVIKDNGNNTFTISGLITAGSNNKFTSAKVYYTTDGSTPTTSSSYRVPTAAGSYSFTINVPSGQSSSVVKTWISCSFQYNSVTAGAADKVVYYYTNGTVPVKPTITDKGNNKFTISGKVSKAGTNNSIKTATLYYTIGSGSQQTKTLTTTSEGSYSFEFDVPSSSASSVVKAKVTCEFNWSGATSQTSEEASATVKYYSVIGKPAVRITDNYNNTFTISGTNAANGTNNTATTTYAWGYSTAYGNSGTGTKSLTIATAANATRTVYAKATATPSWGGDSAKTASASLAIKQYVAPSAPGTPVISYKKSRLTIKENWTFTWTAATRVNTTSPVKGYRIRLYKNGSPVTGLTCSTSNDIIGKGSGTNEYIDRESTSCTVTLSPTAFGFVPGDTVQLGIYSYTRNGVSNTGTQLFNGGGTAEAHVKSVVSTVRNAGIVRVKPNSTWVEGQVYVKVDGSWREAETVNVKAGGTWKESE